MVRCRTDDRGASAYSRFDHVNETGIIMYKLLATLIGGLLATYAFAQTSANTPAIGQAVSGHNSTAAGTSGTGLRKDGTVNTGSAHGAQGQAAAGVNAAGQVVAPSNAVLGTTSANRERTNAQATNTTPPADARADAPATGGRGQSDTKAEKEIAKANAHGVKDVPGSRMKTKKSAEAGKARQSKEQKNAKNGSSAND
jgi:hypothetical protein